MKKLFLTSGLVLCMAGQAYASTDITYNGSAYGASGCNYTYLDTYDTSSSLEAIWESNPYTITLNSHTGANEYGSTAVSPTSLYALYGDAVYLESAHTNAMSTTANGLTTVPTGKTYTLTLNTNVTTAGTGGMNAAHTNDQVTAASGTKAASTTAQMSFAGFYSATQLNKMQTNGTQYIGANGIITTDGISAGTGTASASTWHAQYTCKNAATYTPQLTGYTFAGWYDAANSGNVVKDFCLDSDKTVYAHWTANKYNVIYKPTGNSADSAAAYTHTNGATYDTNYVIPTSGTAGDGVNGAKTAKTGYTFAGWTTDATPTFTDNTLNNQWTGETPWTRTTELIVYAAYTPKQYNVTYAVGTCRGTDKTYNGALTYDANYTVLGTNATGMTVTVPAGYTFNGWKESLSGNTVRAAGYQYKPWQTDSNLTLTAQCSANNINITFDCAKPTAGAAIPGVSGTYPVTASETVSANPATIQIAMDGTGKINQTCSLNGWTFDGWSCSTGLTSDSAGNHSVLFITKAQTETAGGGYQVYMKNAAGVTCKAKWTQNHITLNWNKNGADSADIAATACDYDGSITLPTAPTRNGYTFQGWTVNNGGN
ncbi:MAG: InlB B-repeat-containing protein [Alphaproteobacteria bacterium]